MSFQKYGIQYSTVSKADLKSVYAYIACSLREKSTAENQINRIRQNIRSLDTFPEKFPIVDWEPWHQMGVRKMPVDRYIVYYRVDHETRRVEIVRIFYSRRDVEGVIQRDFIEN